MGERLELFIRKPGARKANPILEKQKTKLSQCAGSGVDQILFFQQTIGNQAVQTLLRSTVVRAKPTIRQPRDIRGTYEEESDKVAKQVPNISGSQIQRQSRQEREEEFQAKSLLNQAPEVATNLQDRINTIKGGGQSPFKSNRVSFESRFGYDFSRVRVYTDSRVAQAARSLNMPAFTVGRNVVFGAEHYAQEANKGQWPLAHELVHTLQRPSYFRIGPKSIQRAGEEKPSRVVIVSGPKKIPKLKEDAAEKLIRTTGARLEKAGLYRFVPVSGYADFVAKAHRRLKANECASTVLIDGHGGSDADSAWMTMGSATDPNRAWGTTEIGNNSGTLVGADVVKNIKFCKPCQVYLGGCNFAKVRPGIKFMQAVANSSGCTVKAYATETTTNPETGFPEPVPEAEGKKPGKP